MIRPNSDNLFSVLLPATAQIIRDAGEWDRLRPQWEALEAVSPAGSPTLSFTWLREWWRIYGPVYGLSGAGLRIVAIRRGPSLIGALPLYEGLLGGRVLGRRRVGFVSSGEAEFEETCADYQDLLCGPGEQDACLQALLPALMDAEQLPWDELSLTEIREDSPLLQLAGQGAEVSESGICPLAQIQGGLEAYLGRLSANTRQQVRRLLRDVRRSRGRFEMAGDLGQAREFFGQMVELHQRRWTEAGEPGSFAAPRFTAFHQALCDAWVPAGKALLGRLSLGGRPVVVIYGFVAGDAFHFYQSGVAMEDQTLRSPGIAGLVLMMEQLAKRGLCWFDFLKGRRDYKQRLSTTQRRLMDVRILRPTLRTGVSTAAHWVRRAANRGRRILNRSGRR